MDFYADLVEIARERLRACGVDCSESTEHRTVIEQWVSLELKLVDPMPRTVIKSAKLTSSSLSAEVQKALSQLESDCIRGEDVNKYLSKGMFRPGQCDYLLADWRIYHLHLGIGLEGSYFIKRSADLLFATFSDRSAYFIDVRPHGEPWVFAQKELLEIVDKEWPELLTPYLSPFATIHPDDQVNDPNEIDKLRRNGIIVAQQVGTRVYYPMGGGVTTAATSVRAADKVDRLIIVARTAAKYAEQNRSSVLAHITKVSGRVTASADLHLRSDANGLFFRDTLTGSIIPPQLLGLGSDPAKEGRRRRSNVEGMVDE